MHKTENEQMVTQSPIQLNNYREIQTAHKHSFWLQAKLNKKKSKKK